MSALDTLSAAPTGDLESLPPAEIVPMVETLLRSALDRLEAEAAVAHAEASAAVAAAVRRSADLVLGRSGAAAPVAPSLPVAAAVPVAPAVPAVHLPAHLAPSHLSVMPDDELGPDIGDCTPAQVYDLFWSDIPADQPIRERLRRWAQRPPV